MKVVFIGHAGLEPNERINYPLINEIVTVKNIIGSPTNYYWYILKEYPENKIGIGVNAIRKECFRDLTFGEQVCENIEFEELILA